MTSGELIALEAIHTVVTQSIRIGWWNTHISPPKGLSRIDLDSGILAIAIISELLSKVDILFLGEVSEKEISILESSLYDTKYGVLGLTGPSRGSKFNLGVIFDKNKVNICSYEYLNNPIQSSNYKIGVWIQADFLNELLIDLYVVHWRSRFLLGEGAPERTHFGASLRSDIDDRRAEGQKNFIVLGDFNDEPFSPSMTTYLCATRDVKLAQAKSNLLYNPFWRYIVCPNGYVAGLIEQEPTGTYFYPQDQLHKWRVFDQILFSNSFIGGSVWHLNESKTVVLRMEKLVEAIIDRKSRIDHLPVICEITKEPHNV